MGTSISAAIANLVMENVEEIAVSTAPHHPCLWYRYVDDSHSYLKKDLVDEFFNRLNSIVISSLPVRQKIEIVLRS